MSMIDVIALKTCCKNCDQLVILDEKDFEYNYICKDRNAPIVKPYDNSCEHFKEGRNSI